MEIKAEHLDNNTKEFVKSNLKEKLPKPLEEAITPSHSRMPQFYALPKDYKEGLPVRPVVSCCDGPTSNLSLVLERILNQLLSYVPTHLASTQQCIQELQQHRRVEKGDLLVSLDVVGLYSNIPIADAIAATVKLLTQHSVAIDMLDLTVEDAQRALQYTLANNVFEFGSQQYRQLKGIAMGNHLAPPLAIIFMASLEEAALQTCALTPCLYKRYIDDIIMLWRHGREELQQFVDHMNSQHPFIRFTVTHSDNDTQSIDFLDLRIGISQPCMLEWKLFVKPSHSGVHLSFLSSVPISTKRAVAKNQYSRAINNASTERGRRDGIKTITELLTANDYPANEIDSAIKHATNMKPRNQSKQPWKKADHVILKLPFVSDILSARVTQRVRKFSPDVRVVFKSGPSLKQQLVRSQLCPRVCPREVQRSKEKRGCGRPMVCRACDAGMTNGDCILKNVVYSMSCTLCGDLYIGETERPVRVRFQEHYRDAKAKLGTSPWGGHYKIQHRDYSTTVSGFHPFHQAKILGRESSLPSRRYLEATEIRRRRPAVNCDSGWRLSA